MSPATTIVLLWLGFSGTHVALSHPPVRARLVSALGAGGFLGAYSIVAFAFFVPLCWVYFAHLHEGAWLFVLPRGPLLTWAVSILSTIGFVLMAASFLQPSPAGMVPGSLEARGVLRLTRHPLFMGLGVVGLAHLLVNTSATDVAFFAGLPLFAIVGCAHQDARKRVHGPPGYAAFLSETPFLPFTGRETLRGLREMGAVPIGLGVALALGVRWAHRFWGG